MTTRRHEAKRVMLDGRPVGIAASFLDAAHAANQAGAGIDLDAPAITLRGCGETITEYRFITQQQERNDSDATG